MRGFMKKTILITALAGTILGSAASIQATATQTTQALGAASVATLSLGSILWAVGHWGPANTVGTVIAAAVGGVAGLATDAIMQALINGNVNLGVLAHNPAVAPIVVGALTFGLMVWLRKNYLPSRIKELEDYGTKLLEIGVGIGTIGAISYVANAAGYKLSMPLAPISDKASAIAPQPSAEILQHII